MEQGKGKFYTKVHNVFNKDKDIWIRPWELEKFDDLYNRDERYFSILIKGLISWLNRNIVLYNKPINHFIFNTGSSYMYVEKTDYEFKWCETTGDNEIYMHMPRCVIELQDINIPMEELTQPYARGNYERRSGQEQINGYNAEIRRLPIELSLDLKYVLSTFNEQIILIQELMDKIVFQKYFNINYLGQIIECSIEFPGNTNPEINKIDMSSPEVNQKNITLNIKVCSNYPIINLESEIRNDQIISEFRNQIKLHDISPNDPDSEMTDNEKFYPKY